MARKMTHNQSAGSSGQRGHWHRALWAGPALLLLLGGSWAGADPGTKSPVEVHFAPTGKDRKIERIIRKEIRQAKQEVLVALYQITSPVLAQALEQAARRRVRVQVLLDEEMARVLGPRSQGRYLEKRGVDVRYVRLPGSGVESPKFHHKFAVLDEAVTVTGSYNWTVLGDEENYENLVILRNPETAKTYKQEFQRIWQDPTLTGQ